LHAKRETHYTLWGRRLQQDNLGVFEGIVANLRQRIVDVLSIVGLGLKPMQGSFSVTSTYMRNASTTKYWLDAENYRMHCNHLAMPLYITATRA
jgi:hypothetical protein